MTERLNNSNKQRRKQTSKGVDKIKEQVEKKRHVDRRVFSVMRVQFSHSVVSDTL